jgi:hypothetical protein
MAERDWRDGFIWFIWFVSFILLVLFNQTNETNQINQITVFFCWLTFSASCQNASFAQRKPVPLGRLSMVPQSRSLVRRLIAGLSQDPPRIALIAPREGPCGSERGASL